MAVIKCRECGGQVSTKADKCPACGAPSKKSIGTIPGLIIILVATVAIFKIFGGGTAQSPAEQVATQAPAQQQARRWSYNRFTDPMSDEIQETLRLRSSGSAEFDFPYKVRGGSYLHMIFRKSGSDLDALFRIDKGQMLCGATECKFSLRVGDGAVQTWTGLPSSTHDHDIMFVRDAQALESIVKKGEPVRIGIEFYQSGVRAFDFDVTDYPGFQ